MADNCAHLSVGDKACDLPILTPTLGTPVVDIAPLSKAGYFTYDPGYAATASCSSKITFIDGDKGILLYRGYPIEALANNSNFMEVSYLLLHGELPNQSQLTDFLSEINQHTMLHEQMRHFFNGFRRDAHPMAIMVGVVGALSAFYHTTTNIQEPDDRKKTAIRLIAKMVTIAAMCHKYYVGQPFMQPKNSLSYSENFLQMMFGLPTEDYHCNPVLAKAIDKIFILHADHEQNASTSTVRLAGSTGANPYACISAGISALWGPKHGGANEAALNMLRQIGHVSHIPEYIKRAKDKDDPFRLMGFGHRVYKNFDPRATVMRQTCHEVLDTIGRKDDPILQVALELERIALEDEYFVERKLYPNIDFYSGITLDALGIPINMFTSIFALARTAGWIAHWDEMIESGVRIGRPRQLYMGEKERAFVAVKGRK